MSWVFDPPEEDPWIDVEPVDELAIEASMDYCETCGRYTAGDDACVACGDEDAEAKS